MSLPGRVREDVELALPRVGVGSRIESVSPVGGGCINNGARLQTDTGATVFLKWNPQSPGGMFAGEAEGLEALRERNVLRVPKPLARSQVEEDGISWLLLEFIASGPGSGEIDRLLGRGLALLHTPLPEASFGWSSDNWIGSLPQANTSRSRWADFWWDMRLAPQLEKARRRGFLGEEVFDRLPSVLPSALGDVASPCLVHGDLWGGNTFPSESGEPVVIDPAVYRGHGEVDLAMTELFGGFTSAFYAAYGNERKISLAYHAYRRDLYQLYYLLVHVNLFGASYEAGCRRAANRVVDELG